MEVKIGIADVSREVTVTTEDNSDELVARLHQALEAGGLFEIIDDKGRRVVIPAARVAYLDLGAEDVRPVGFGSLR